MALFYSNDGAIDVLSSNEEYFFISDTVMFCHFEYTFLPHADSRHVSLDLAGNSVIKESQSRWKKITKNYHVDNIYQENILNAKPKINNGYYNFCDSFFNDQVHLNQLYEGEQNRITPISNDKNEYLINILGTDSAAVKNLRFDEATNDGVISISISPEDRIFDKFGVYSVRFAFWMEITGISKYQFSTHVCSSNNHIGNCSATCNRNCHLKSRLWLMLNNRVGVKGIVDLVRKKGQSLSEDDIIDLKLNTRHSDISVTIPTYYVLHERKPQYEIKSVDHGYLLYSQAEVPTSTVHTYRLNSCTQEQVDDLPFADTYQYFRYFTLKIERKYSYLRIGIRHLIQYLVFPVIFLLVNEMLRSRGVNHISSISDLAFSALLFYFSVITLDIFTFHKDLIRKIAAEFLVRSGLSFRFVRKSKKGLFVLFKTIISLAIVVTTVLNSQFVGWGNAYLLFATYIVVISNILQIITFKFEDLKVN